MAATLIGASVALHFKEVTMGLKLFQSALADTLFGKTPSSCCVSCKQPFSRANVFTPAGWNETGISRMCEVCFDEAVTTQDD